MSPQAQTQTQAQTFCPHCKKPVLWFRMAPDGRKLPVDPEPSPTGQLEIDPATGWLTRFVERHREATRYNSHLASCRPMARALHLAANIVLPKASDCSTEGCEIQGRHIHCFTCGEAGHVASVCENFDENEAKELHFE